MKALTSSIVIAIISVISTEVYSQFYPLQAGYYNDTICYTDIAPDSTFTAVFSDNFVHVYDLDLDKDGIKDFKFAYYWSPTNGRVTRYVSLMCYDVNKIAISRYDTATIHKYNDVATIHPVAEILNLGDTIHEGLDFRNVRAVLAETDGYPGGYTTFDIEDWIDIGDKFIGCSINRNDTTIYCWIKINVHSDRSFTLKSFAANIEDRGSYISLNHSNEFSIYPNPASGYIVVSYNQDYLMNCNVEIFNNLSQKMIFINTDIGISHKRIELNDLNPGLYFLRISSDKIRSVNKLIVK